MNNDKKKQPTKKPKTKAKKKSPKRKRTIATREQWLNKLARAMRKRFEKEGALWPKKMRMTCGWPSGGAKSSTLGQCFYSKASKDHSVEIFISPTQDDKMEVVAILAHELIHACLGAGHGHGPKFRKIALAIGLEGKMTATVPGKEFKRWVKPLLKVAGPYPHKELTAPVSKQDWDAHINLACPHDDYYMRTKVYMFQLARPVCPMCGGEMMTKIERDMLGG